jgi:hypothetical protein
VACDVVSHGTWGWEIVLSRDGCWFFAQRFPTVNLAEAEAAELKAKHLLAATSIEAPPHRNIAH